MRTATFIWIVFTFFLWKTGSHLIDPPQVLGQDPVMQSQENIKDLLRQMIPDRLAPGTAPEELPEQGAPGVMLLQKYCSQCHDIVSPKMHSAEKWISVLQRVTWHMQMMPLGRKIDRMIQLDKPSPEETADLLNYLKRHSLQVADLSTLEHLDEPSGVKYLHTCAQCHALPDLKQHTTQEWPGVTARMKQNMEYMHRPAIQPWEEILIVQFLQYAASQ